MAGAIWINLQRKGSLEPRGGSSLFHQRTAERAGRVAGRGKVTGSAKKANRTNRQEKKQKR